MTMSVFLKSAQPADPNAVTKAFAAFEIKDADKGEVEAIVATLGVVDRDGDIIRPGAIVDGAKVVVSSWGHDAVWGERPIGKGTLHIVGNKVVFKGRIFLSTIEGRETFVVLKEMGADQEWSFGFRVTGWELPSEDEKKDLARRILTKLGAFEVSPVLMGAGIGTRTTAVKQADGDAGEPPPAGTPADPAAAVVTEGEQPPAERPATAADPVAAAAAEEAQKAAARALELKALEEFDRFQRTQRRLGGAAA